MCALVLMAAIYAGAFYPQTLGATLAYREGLSAERARDFDQAIQEYEKVLNAYPDWRPAMAHLGISLYRNGNTLEAIWVLGGVWRRSNPQEITKEVNRIFREIKRQAGVK